MEERTLTGLVGGYGGVGAKGSGFGVFQSLMPFHVQNILLVSSLYDAFILQEDGQFNELILGEYLDLNLRHNPDLIHVSSGAEALEALRNDSQRRIDLIVTTTNLGDMDANQLAQEVRRGGFELPICVLAYDAKEMSTFAERNSSNSEVDRIYLWQGNARILLALVKQVEDLRNLDHDTSAVGVRVIIVVEDNIRYYSSFLPTIYTELIAQSQSLLSDGMNLSHKLVRMRARPKILLCSTYEEAWAAFERYGKYLLGVISDIEFPRDGELSASAGFDLMRAMKERAPDLPILLQSSRVKYRKKAWAAGASFLLKGSPTLLTDLRRFMIERFSFGDFVMRMPDGAEVGRASDLKTLEELLHTVPAECIAYHASRNHFSNWLTARTEFGLARRLRAGKVSDHETLEHLRRSLIRAIEDYRRDRGEMLFGDFDRNAFHPDSGFSRIGGGSFGGKARGLVFVRQMLSMNNAARRFPGIHISVPPCVVLATDVFDAFLEQNELLDLAMCTDDESLIRRRVMRSRFPREVLNDLAAYLEVARYPLAIRSSSLLEDSQYQPFTGVYETYLLPNNHPDLRVRLKQLVRAVKQVYASAFSNHAKRYLAATSYRLEEEKMAVMLQRIVGAPHNGRFYPDFAGVARSHNFYPSAPQTSQDGIVAVALGLGRTVVEGEKCLTFCPRYPRHLVQFSSVKDILANSQRHFWALNLNSSPTKDNPLGMRGERHGLEVAEQDHVLGMLGSTYSHDNMAIYDGIARPGVRLVSFASILKHRMFPLAEIVEYLLELGSRAMGRPVEIEFAVNLSAPRGKPKEFGFLQMRPLALSKETEELSIESVAPEQLICSSPKVLGNGKIQHLQDVVAVDIRRFDRSWSREVAQEVSRYNAELRAKNIPYVLIGVGRWGSSDPWLGIPVTWDQISGARVIVEAGFQDMRVTPSQGSHFFQNLSAFQVGYFTVNQHVKEGFVDWDWLGEQEEVSRTEYVRHLHFERPIVVKMNGRKSQGIICKPQPPAAASGEPLLP